MTAPLSSYDSTPGVVRAIADYDSAADHAKFLFWQLAIAFLVGPKKMLPYIAPGKMASQHAGGRNRGGPAETGRLIPIKEMPLVTDPQLREIALSVEEARALQSLGSTPEGRLVRYEAIQLQQQIRILKTYFELQLFKNLTTLANWHPTASATVGAAQRFTEAAAKVYQSVFGILQATGADTLVLGPRTFHAMCESPDIRDQLGDVKDKTLDENDLLGLFQKRHKNLKRVHVAFAVDDPEDDEDYLVDKSAIPEFAWAGKLDIPGMPRLMAEARPGQPLPTLDVAMITGYDSPEHNDGVAAGRRVAADELAYFSVDIRERNAHFRDGTLWASVTPNNIKKKRGAALVGTVV